MHIPSPDEFAKAGGYNPFPGKWNKWLLSVREGILSAQPIAGRHVSVDEHPGKGTVINVDDTATRRGGGGGGGGGGCCPDGAPITIVTSGILLDCGCQSAQGGSFIIVDGNPSVPGSTINGTFSLAFSSPGQWTGAFFVNTNTFWNTGGCSGPPSDGNHESDWTVSCSAGINTLAIYAFDTTFGVLIFYGQGPTGTAIPNTLSCGSIAPNGQPAFGHGGSAVITCG